jgi:hypothetical protein
MAKKRPGTNPGHTHTIKFNIDWDLYPSPCRCLDQSTGACTTILHYYFLKVSFSTDTPLNLTQRIYVNCGNFITSEADWLIFREMYAASS